MYTAWPVWGPGQLSVGLHDHPPGVCDSRSTLEHLHYIYPDTHTYTLIPTWYTTSYVVCVPTTAALNNIKCMRCRVRPFSGVPRGIPPDPPPFPPLSFNSKQRLLSASPKWCGSFSSGVICLARQTQPHIEFASKGLSWLVHSWTGAFFPFPFLLSFFIPIAPTYVYVYVYYSYRIHPK